MVRLVFRPYTQIRRTICTSVSLRASTRVSPGFALFRHRSPSFGSQHVCSYSNLSQVIDRSIVPPLFIKGSNLNGQARLYFHCASGFCTQILAYMSDSLVRVSRRVSRNHFVSITIAQYLTHQYRAVKPAELCSPRPSTQQGQDVDAKRAIISSVKSKVGPTLAQRTSGRLSPPNLTDADPPQVTGDAGDARGTKCNQRNAQRPPHTTNAKYNKGHDWFLMLPS
jgi:hypothetical protein